MNNDRIYSASELKNVGVFDESHNTDYEINRKIYSVSINIFESLHCYNKEGFNGVSLFIFGGGNIILKNISLSEFVNLVNNTNLYYVYSRKYETWFIYSIE
jgi:hypothetical protein